MVLLTFLAALGLAALHFLSAGPLFYGFSIYKLAYWAVLTSCSFSLWINKATIEQWATVVLIAVNMHLGWKAWGTADPVLWHALLHVLIAFTIVCYAQTRASLIVVALFLANVLFAVLELYGVLPDRPRVFTGFYYPDLIAYSGHAAMIITAGAAGDTGRLLKRHLVARPDAFLHLRYVCLNRLHLG